MKRKGPRGEKLQQEGEALKLQVEAFKLASTAEGLFQIYLGSAKKRVMVYSHHLPKVKPQDEMFGCQFELIFHIYPCSIMNKNNHNMRYMSHTSVSLRNEKPNGFNVKTISTLFTKTTPYILLSSGTQGLKYVQTALGIHKFVKIPLRWLPKWTFTFQLSSQ